MIQREYIVEKRDYDPPFVVRSKLGAVAVCSCWTQACAERIAAALNVANALNAIDEGRTARAAREAISMTCERCGCTNAHACPNGCIWVAPNLCSRCAVILLYEESRVRNDSAAAEAAAQLDQLAHVAGAVEDAFDDGPRILRPGDPEFFYTR